MSIFGPRTALATFVALPFVAAALLAGCATTLEETPAPSMTCEQIDREIADTRIARTQALEKQQDPWKFVIPFAVAGRHVAAASSVGEADRLLAELSAEGRNRGCTLYAETH